jgi:hypothetical protein
MKCSIVTIVSILGLVGASPSSLDKRSKPQGLDVSAWQGNVNWAQVKANGASFAIVKANPLILDYLITISNSTLGQQKALAIRALISHSNTTVPTSRG